MKTERQAKFKLEAPFTADQLRASFISMFPPFYRVNLTNSTISIKLICAQSNQTNFKLFDADMKTSRTLVEKSSLVSANRFSEMLVFRAGQSIKTD